MFFNRSFWAFVTGVTKNLTVETALVSSGTTSLTGASSLTGGTTIGTGGTSLNIVRAGQVTVGAAEASKALTLTGVAAGDLILANISSANTGAVYIVKAVATTNTVTVTLSDVPGASTTVDIVAIRRTT